MLDEQELTHTDQAVEKTTAEAEERTIRTSPLQVYVENAISNISSVINNALLAVLQNATQKLAESFQPLAELAKYIQEAEHLYQLAEGEAVRILIKYKWFFTPMMPTDLLFEVVRIGIQEEQPHRKINALFVNYYSHQHFEELEALMEVWEQNSLFKPRMKILRDCFNVLRYADEKYNPSNVILPTLISQIDGFLTDYLDSSARGRDFRDKLLDKTKDEYFPELLHAVLFDRLFQYSNKVDREPFTFSRHKVMHGQSLRYGRIDNTIRAFLILDFLAGLK